MNNTNLPQIFDYNGSEFRTIIDEQHKPWFVAADVCHVLEIANTSKACERLDEDEKGITTSYTPSGNQDLLIINESGLFSLILTSRKPEAKRFKKWITSEVLPSIRETGSYSNNQMSQLSPSEMFMLQARINMEYEGRLNQFEERLNAIEDEKKRAISRLQLIGPTTNNPVPEISVRSKVNILVRSYGELYKLDYRDLWKQLYLNFKYRYHIDIAAKAKKFQSENLKLIDVAERIGVINQLHDLASHLFKIEEDHAA